MDENWIVKIVEDYPRIGLKVWIFRPLAGGRTELYKSDGTAEIFFQGEDSSKEPSLILFPGMLKPFIQALTNKGVRLDIESIHEGKLDAMGNHLEDLRHLLDLPRKS